MLRGLYATSAGMHCLYDQSPFQSVKDYDSWARELLEDQDIRQHITAGHLVPLNVGSDGGMEVEVRVGSVESPAVLSAREQQYLIVASKPYRLVSTGQIAVCGIESVTTPAESSTGQMTLPPGEYAALVHLMAWDEEPGMQTDTGPAPGALPDYLVLLNPATPGTEFRTEIGSFK